MNQTIETNTVEFEHSIPYLEKFACFDDSRSLSTWTVLDPFGFNTVINHRNLGRLEHSAE